MLASWCLLIMLTACVDDLSISPKEGSRKVVVSCVLHNTKVQKLQLTYSNPVNEPSFFRRSGSGYPYSLRGRESSGHFPTKSRDSGEWELNYHPSPRKEISACSRSAWTSHHHSDHYYAHPGGHLPWRPTQPKYNQTFHSKQSFSSFVDLCTDFEFKGSSICAQKSPKLKMMLRLD